SASCGSASRSASPPTPTAPPQRTRARRSRARSGRSRGEWTRRRAGDMRAPLGRRGRLGSGGAVLVYALYSAGLWLLFLAYLPVFAWRKLARTGYRRGLGQRWGHFAPGLPPEPRCWIHAVSVGEAAAAVPLVEAIGRRWPELGMVVTTVTPTGARIVAGRLAGRAVHRYFPVDLPQPVPRALDPLPPP